jgi:hypothetical protein
MDSDNYATPKVGVVEIESLDSGPKEWKCFKPVEVEVRNAHICQQQADVGHGR